MRETPDKLGHANIDATKFAGAQYPMQPLLTGEIAK